MEMPTKMNVVGGDVKACADANNKNWDEISTNDTASKPRADFGNTEKRMIDSVAVKEAHGYSFASTSWSDGTTFDFPFMFLRDNCQCSACFDHSSGQRKVMIDTIGDDIKGETTISAGGLSLEWKDGHRSVFSADWLGKRVPNDAAKQSDLRKVEWEPWSAQDMQKRCSRHNYSQVASRPPNCRAVQTLNSDRVYVRSWRMVRDCGV